MANNIVQRTLKRIRFNDDKLDRAFDYVAEMFKDVILDSAKQQATTDANATPSGVVMDYAGGSAPSGWLLCDGSAISRNTYADLFTAIGTTFGSGDGVTTFNLPDLRGRTIAGKDDMGGTAANRITSGGSGITGTTLGAAGGAQTHTLTGSESGTEPHSHGVTDPTHRHTYNRADTANNNTQAGIHHRIVGTGYTTDFASTGISINNASSSSASSAHQNTQPTMIMNKIIKV